MARLFRTDGTTVDVAPENGTATAPPAPKPLSLAQDGAGSAPPWRSEMLGHGDMAIFESSREDWGQLLGDTAAVVALLGAPAWTSGVRRLGAPPLDLLG